MDVLLDDNNIPIIRDGKFVFCTPLEESRQRNLQHFKHIYGTYFLNTESGLPYTDLLFTGLITVEETIEFIRREITRIPGNLEILTFSPSVEEDIRNLSVKYSVLTENGVLTDIKIKPVNYIAEGTIKNGN